jgi:hypothetical protein
MYVSVHIKGKSAIVPKDHAPKFTGVVDVHFIAI